VLLFTGAPTSVQVDMNVRSMGPISELESVSAMHSQSHCVTRDCASILNMYYEVEH